MLDANNHPIQIAKVYVSNAEDTAISNLTDAVGGFILKGIPFGNSSLHIEASGHTSSTRYL